MKYLTRQIKKIPNNNDKTQNGKTKKRFITSKSRNVTYFTYSHIHARKNVFPLHFMGHIAVFIIVYIAQ